MADEHTINLKFEDWEDTSSGLEEVESQLGDSMESLKATLAQLGQQYENAIQAASKPVPQPVAVSPSQSRPQAEDPRWNLSSFLTPPTSGTSTQEPPQSLSTLATLQGSSQSQSLSGSATGGSGGSTSGSGASGVGGPPTPSTAPPTPGGTGGSGGGPPLTTPPPSPVTPPPSPGGGTGGAISSLLLLGAQALPWLAIYHAMKRFGDSLDKTAQSTLGFSQQVTQATVQARLLDLQANMRRADRIGEILGDFVYDMGQLNNSVKGLWDEIIRFFANDIKIITTTLNVISGTLSALLFSANVIREIIQAGVPGIFKLTQRIVNWLLGRDDEGFDAGDIDKEINEFFKIGREDPVDPRRGDSRP